jgi:hypothetical protein
MIGGATAPADVRIRLVLIDPPAGIDYGIQSGAGTTYETLFVQQRTRGDVVFEFTMPVADTRKDGGPNFLGPFAQGPPAARFVYIDVGTCAGQPSTPWSRRMKVPLGAITWPLVQKVMKSGGVLEAKIPGTAKDGGPNCATVRLLGRWTVVGG